MTEKNEEKKQAWEALLHEPRKREVEIETPYGKVTFGIIIPGWTVIEKLRSDCMTITPNTGQIQFDQAEFTRKKLLTCIVDHPFPKEQFNNCITNLSSKVKNILSKAIEAEIEGEEDIAKN